MREAGPELREPAEIRHRDPAAAELLERCLAAPSDPEPLEAFCAHVLKPVGG